MLEPDRASHDPDPAHSALISMRRPPHRLRRPTRLRPLRKPGGPPPEADLNTGRIRGRWTSAQHGAAGSAQFLGIPYGADTSPRAAFCRHSRRPAMDRHPRGHRLMATSRHRDQAGAESQGEDCLVLNVWAPEHARQRKAAPSSSTSTAAATRPAPVRARSPMAPTSPRAATPSSSRSTTASTCSGISISLGRVGRQMTTPLSGNAGLA